jgi:histone H3/H4
MRRLLSTQPLARTSERALDVLTEVAARYIALLASTAASRAQHSGRTRPAFWDVAAAIDDLGTDVEELADWVQDGAGLSASDAHRDPALAGE